MKIKKLVWEDRSIPEMMVKYHVDVLGGFYEVINECDNSIETHLTVSSDECITLFEKLIICDDPTMGIEEAKQAAQDDWENKLKKFLEE